MYQPLYQVALVLILALLCFSPSEARGEYFALPQPREVPVGLGYPAGGPRAGAGSCPEEQLCSLSTATSTQSACI